MEEHESAKRQEGCSVGNPEVAIADAQDISEKKMGKINLHLGKTDQNDPECESDDVERSDGGLFL